MPYSPTATADMFCTFLDPTGSKTLSFADDNERDSAFTNGSVGTKTALGSNFDYVRKDNVLKVNYNADVLDAMGVNYVRYKNPRNGEQTVARYIYAFVDSIEYLAPETSALHLRTDSFMTYQSKIGSSQAYIKRHTVDETGYTFGANRVNEPITGGNYRHGSYVAGQTYNVTNSTSFDNLFYIGLVISPGIPVEDGDRNAEVKKFLSDNGTVWLSGTPSAGVCILCTLTGTCGIAKVMRCLEILACTVIATFVVPKEKATGNTVVERHQSVIAYTSTLEDYEDIDFAFYTANMDALISGYTNFKSVTVNPPSTAYVPRHKKCYQYPFSYVRVSDFSGASKIYKYEDSETNDGNPEIRFSESFLIAPNGCMATHPTTMLNPDDPTNMWYFSVTFPQIPYLQTAYGQYLGANNNSLIFNRLEDNVSGAVSLIEKGVEITKSINASTSTAGAAMGALSGLYDMWTGTIAPRMEKLNAERDLSKSTMVNAPTVNTLFATFGWCLMYAPVHLVNTDMERVDKYFDRYGYAIEQVETVNWKSCPDYDYVETSGFVVKGTIPVADKENIQKLFNAGITIWHKVARYGLYADDGNPNASTETP